MKKEKEKIEKRKRMMTIQSKFTDLLKMMAVLIECTNLQKIKRVIPKTFSEFLPQIATPDG